MAKQAYFAAKNERMFMCKQNYPSVMEEVHRSIDCENGSNDQKSLSYRLHDWSDELILLISQVCLVWHNMIVDMWRRGELRSEVGEIGEAVDVVSEFGDEITGVMGYDVDHECTGEEERSSNSTPTAFEALLERSSVVMIEERQIKLQSELAQHLWNRRGDSA